MQEGLKYDNDKIRLDLIDPLPIIELGKILTYGANKYKENSWQNLENAENRYYAAALRHLYDYRLGNSIDSESSLLHIAHAFCNLYFLLYFELKKINHDKVIS